VTGSLDKVKNIVLCVDTILGNNAGEINFDSTHSVMNIRNTFTGSSLQVGQEQHIFAINNTCCTITDGKAVKVIGYDAAADALEIEPAKSDIVNGVSVGMTTTSMTAGATGLVTTFGRVNDLDTSSFSAGDVVYVSPTVAGDITATRPAIPTQIGIVGKVDACTGFINVLVKELEKSIYGVYNHLADLTFTANTDTPLPFDDDGEVSGITHSTCTDNEQFTFPNKGVYQATIEPQLGRSTGSSPEIVDTWVDIDTGCGFTAIAHTNIKRSAGAVGDTGIAPLTTTFRVNAGDKIRFMARSTSTDMEFEFTAAVGNVPDTPAYIMNLVRVGD